MSSDSRPIVSAGSDDAFARLASRRDSTLFTLTSFFPWKEIITSKFAVRGDGSLSPPRPLLRTRRGRRRHRDQWTARNDCRRPARRNTVWYDIIVGVCRRQGYYYVRSANRSAAGVGNVGRARPYVFITSAVNLRERGHFFGRSQNAVFAVLGACTIIGESTRERKFRLTVSG